MASLRLHEPAVWSAPCSPLLPGLGTIVGFPTPVPQPYRRGEGRPPPSRVRISSGPSPSLGLARNRCAELAWRWFSSAIAGVWPLSAAMIPRGVDRKTPSVSLPIRVIALWYSPSTPPPRSK